MTYSTIQLRMYNPPNVPFIHIHKKEAFKSYFFYYQKIKHLKKKKNHFLISFKKNPNIHKACPTYTSQNNNNKKKNCVNLISIRVLGRSVVFFIFYYHKSKLGSSRYVTGNEVGHR